MISLALLGLLLMPPPTFATSLGLSPNDLARLNRGEIVFKEHLPAAEGAPVGHGGTAFALLRTDSEWLWEILTDFDHYAGLFPRLRESEVMDHEGPRTRVRFHVAVGPFNFRFTVNHIVSVEDRQIRWRLDRSQRNDLFRDTWGYWQVDPLSNGRVLVTYAMGSQTVLPAFLTRGSERESVVKTVQALKARTEQGRRASTN